jgi:hypothetical protein
MIVYRIDLLDNEGKISSSERVVRRNDQDAACVRTADGWVSGW